MKTKFLNTRELVFCALCIALAEVMRFIGITLPLAGINALRINIGGIFYFLPSVIYGPLAGGITCVVYDILGLFIKPEGEWIPLLTATALLGGILRGVFWNSLKYVLPLNNQKYNFKLFIRLLIAFLLAGIITTTLNTHIIMNVYGIKKAFIVFYTPRLIEEIVSNVLITVILFIIFPHIKFFETGK